jgi:hypothetical protein
MWPSMLVKMVVFLYHKEYNSANLCPVHGQSRYIPKCNSKVPKKMFHHFPLIPRLRRMFRIPSLFELMR